jgi:hypothetical protein
MPIDIPHLREKIARLPECPPKAATLAAQLTHQNEADQCMDGPSLSRASTDNRLPTHYTRSLLSLYGLRVPADLDPANDAHKPWFDALQEPDLHAFDARIRILGGAVQGDPAGTHWDRFCSGEVAERAASMAAESIRFHRFDRPLATGPSRAFPEGAWTPPAPRRAVPTLHAHERVSLVLALGDVLTPRPQRYHLFCFYDVRDAASRWAVPLLPAPPVTGVRMPPAYSDDSLFEIPESPTRDNCLRVDAGWDERALIAVVTSRPLETELTEDTREEGPILFERLDLLAARLQDKRRWPTGSWAMLKLAYQVTEAPQGG